MGKRGGKAGKGRKAEGSVWRTFILLAIAAAAVFFLVMIYKNLFSTATYGIG
ncbi:hypothetical protein HYV82_00760 [Candidatus Woesearchaeota archaeon]|nr:hypothetical protein [Candidatus Woesearchaeota archaeon]